MQKLFAIGMGTLLTGVLFCFQPANASYLFPDVSSHPASRHLSGSALHAARTDRAHGDVRLHGGSLGECHDAVARDGSVKPCGCWAQHRLLGTYTRLWHGINLYLADNWIGAFERAAAAPGMAAVKPHQHVAPIIGESGDKMLLADSWATHWVSKRGWVIVDPRRPRNTRWASNF